MKRRMFTTVLYIAILTACSSSAGGNATANAGSNTADATTAVTSQMQTSENDTVTESSRETAEASLNGKTNEDTLVQEAGMELNLEDLPDGLEDFLSGLSNYDGNAYDYQEEITSAEAHHALYNVLKPYACVKYKIYPGLEDSEYDDRIVNDVPDPLEKFDLSLPYIAGYEVFDAEAIDWILTHVFHSTNEQITAMRGNAEDADMNADQYFYQGKYYRVEPDGLGGPGRGARVDQILTEGNNRYLVIFHVGTEIEMEDVVDRDGEGEAIVSWEEDDGFGYWTIYSFYIE